MTSAPLLSIITPVYNSLDLLPATSASVTALDIDYEWIVVDDLSTDRTVAYVKELAALNSRISINVNARHIGDAWAGYEVGLTRARGRYVIFLDHDDTLPACHALQEALLRLEECPDIHVAISRVAYMDARARVYKIKSIPFARYGGVIRGRQLFWLVFLWPTYPLKQGALVIRRSFHERIGHVFDIDFLLEATAHTDFALVPHVGLRYRNVWGSASTQRGGHRMFLWATFAARYFPNRRYYGLRYLLAAYKTCLQWLKILYSAFTPNRI